MTSEHLDALQAAAEAAKADPDGRAWEQFWDDLTEDTILELITAHRAALARIARVEALHEPVNIEPSETICGHCSYQLPNGRYFGKVIEWPCDTVRALTEGEPSESES